MQRLLNRLCAPVLVALLLAACGDSASLLGVLSVEQVSPIGSDGTFTIAGANFIRYEDGRGMRVEVCGVTLPAAIMDSVLTEILLPPAGVIKVQTGSELSVTLPMGLTGGSGDLRIIRPDGQVTVVEGAIVCPAAPDPEPEPEPEPDPDPTAHAVLVADPTEGIAPLVVSFDASGSYGEGEHTILWDFGDGETSSALSTQHTFSEPGEYTVALTVTGENGLVDSTTQRIVVTDSQAPTARIDFEVDRYTSAYTDLFVSGLSSSDPNGLPITYLWAWVDLELSQRTYNYATIGGKWDLGYDLKMRLTVTNSEGRSNTTWLTFLADQPETLLDASLPANQPDILHAEWGYDGNRVHITVEYVQPPLLLAPGDGLCAPAGIAFDAYLGYIGIDIDRDSTSGWDYGQHDGLEYVLMLEQRRADGRFPLYRAGAGNFDPCDVNPPEIVRWVDVEQDGTRVTFSFDELEGRGNEFNVGVHTSLYPNGESDTLTIVHSLPAIR